MLLAPETWGDIVPINLDGNTTWYFSKHAFLACTHQVVRSHKAQGLGKALCKLLTNLTRLSQVNDISFR